VLKG